MTAYFDMILRACVSTHIREMACLLLECECVNGNLCVFVCYLSLLRVVG